jgi:TonB family protein
MVTRMVPGVGGVGYPACLYCPKPQLPDTMHNLQEHVTVVTGIIQTNRRATSIEIVRSGGTGFGDKAIETVRRWHFKPAVGPDGKPVPVTTHIEVTWN